MTGHSLTLNETEDRWDYATCDCGWIGPPCPDKEIAAEFWADHLLSARIDGAERDG